MDKATFLKQLSAVLAGCSKAERSKSLNYYSELIEDYKEAGMSETEAVAALGSPAEIAANILEEQGGASHMSAGVKILIGALLVLGFPLWGSLVLAAALLVLSAYILLWCVPLICGCLSVAALIVAAVSVPGSIVVMTQSLALGTMQLGLGMVAAGVLIPGAWITVFLCKRFADVTKRLTLAAFGWLQKAKVGR